MTKAVFNSIARIVRRTTLRRCALCLCFGLVAVYGMLAYQGNGGPWSSLPGISSALAQVSPWTRGAMATFVVKSPPKPMPDVTFKDGDGKQRKLSDWRGRVVLLNLWATWCAPCRREMPSLDRLRQTMAGDDFELLAVSIDRKGAKVAQEFLVETGATNLDLYIDTTAKISRDLRAFGLPATFLISRDGRELGRLVGPAEWDSPEAKALIQAAIDGKLGGVKASQNN